MRGRRGLEWFLAAGNCQLVFVILNVVMAGVLEALAIWDILKKLILKVKSNKSHIWTQLLIGQLFKKILHKAQHVMLSAIS